MPTMCLPPFRLFLRTPQPKGGLLGRDGAVPPLTEVTTEGFKVQIIAEGKEVWILKLKEVKDRNEAELLRSYSIVMPVTAREKLRDPDEFYAQDLIGSYVFLIVRSKWCPETCQIHSPSCFWFPFDSLSAIRKFSV